MRHSEDTDAVFPHDYRFERRVFSICGEGPGHGVDIDEKLAARYPYKPRIPARWRGFPMARCGTGNPMALFEYFPNYIWNLSVAMALESGGQIGEIIDMCAADPRCGG